MSDFWSEILGSGVSTAGYADLLSGIDQQQDRLTTDFNNIATGIQGNTQFTPWGVTSASGTATGGPGGINYQLSPEAQMNQAIMQQMAGQQFTKANANPYNTQLGLFNEMTGAMDPVNARAQKAMAQQLFNSGRSGMTSNTYGGTPEQLAYAKALQEQQAGNWMQSGLTARGDATDAYNRGMGYAGLSFKPMEQLMNQGQQGLSFQGMNQTMQQQVAGMLAQLGLGKATADVNYSNIKAGALGDMYGAGSDLARTVGSGIDEAGGLLDFGQDVLDFGQDIWGSIWGNT